MLVFSHAQTRPDLKRSVILGNQTIKSSEKNTPSPMNANLTHHARRACKNDVNGVNTGIKHAPFNYRQTSCPAGQAASFLPPPPQNG
jgi:hypothetical protein